MRSLNRLNGTLLLVTALLLGGCASGGGGFPDPTGPEPPEPGPGIENARGVPGFDTRDYPGDAAMATWRESSPYRWVGYYLPAPCYTGSTWTGKRQSLARAGWGLAVLFVGEQDWSERAAGATAVAADSAAPRCTRDNLTAERGRADADAAERAAAADGFPTGTVVYLDVERVESISPELRAYVEAWAEALLAGGRYVPGLYAHADNAEALRDRMTAVFRRHGRTDAPRLWVASTGGFNLRRAPSESGYPAAIWQGELDARETWGDVTLRIDANVADSPDPSAPGG